MSPEAACTCKSGERCVLCWKEPLDALQALAADNARLCSIGLAADKLAEAIQKYFTEWAPPRNVDSFTWHTQRAKAVRDALAAYRIARNGQ